MPPPDPTRNEEEAYLNNFCECRQRAFNNATHIKPLRHKDDNDLGAIVMDQLELQSHEDTWTNPSKQDTTS